MFYWMFVLCVFAESRTMFLHRPSSVNGKESGSDQALFQRFWCVRGCVEEKSEAVGVRGMVNLVHTNSKNTNSRNNQVFLSRIADSTFNLNRRGQIKEHCWLHLAPYLEFALHHYMRITTSPSDVKIKRNFHVNMQHCSYTQKSWMFFLKKNKIKRNHDKHSELAISFNLSPSA